jgi:predicted cupin superfamily sugar epimerase
MTIKRIEQLKRTFKMIAHPEGGFYAEQYRASEQVLSPINGLERSTLSHIYFLLSEMDISRWHKVLHDEIWHVYEGAPLRILSFDAESRDKVIVDEIIGDTRPEVSTDYFKVIQGGQFQAAQSTGSYTFLGCSVAPGFIFDDFSYVEDTLTQQWVIEQGKDYARFL